MDERSHPYHLNKLVELFENGKKAIGTFSLSQSVTAAIFLPESESDFVILDLEHDPFDIRDLQTYLFAMVDKSAILRKKNLQPDIMPIVRIPQSGQDRIYYMIKQVLDIGAFGILIPRVNTGEDAEFIIRAAQYPHKKDDPVQVRGGIRGASPHNCCRYWGVDFDEYCRHAGIWPLDPDGDIIVMFMIEDKEGVANIEEIVTVPGVGAIFIGPYDLSHSLGIPGKVNDPEVEENIQRVLKACIKHTVPCGMPMTPDTLEKRLKEGFTYGTSIIDAGRLAADAYRMRDIFNKIYR